MIRSLACLVVLICVSAVAAPKKIITVAADGSADFKDVQAAVTPRPAAAWSFASSRACTNIC
jgi:hypothetical protein